LKGVVMIVGLARNAPPTGIAPANNIFGALLLTERL